MEKFAMLTMMNSKLFFELRRVECGRKPGRVHQLSVVPSDESAKDAAATFLGWYLEQN